MEAASMVAVIEVEDLDAAGVLARIADAERRDREVQLEKQRLAHQWCVQHPATTEPGTATWVSPALVTVRPPSVGTVLRRWPRSPPRSSAPQCASPPGPRWG